MRLSFKSPYIQTASVVAMMLALSHLVLAESRVVSVGWNDFGQASVPTRLTNAIAVAAGWHSSLALNADGTVEAWGAITNTPAGLHDVISIAAGGSGNGDYNLALKADGTVVAWGDNAFGTDVPSGLSSVVAIAAGGAHCVALKSDGTVVTWGDNSLGQTTGIKSLSDIVAVAAGREHTLALKSNGTVIAAGFDHLGSTEVPPDLLDVVGIEAGYYSSFALKANGTVEAWGDYELPGCCGWPATVQAGLSNVVAIAAGETYSLALKDNGMVVASGPYEILPSQDQPEDVVAISGGDLHALFLVKDARPSVHAPITDITKTANSFRCTIPTESGRVYRLEYKDSLASRDWAALPLVAGNGGFRSLADFTVDSACRFYRVRRW